MRVSLSEKTVVPTRFPTRFSENIIKIFGFPTRFGILGGYKRLKICYIDTDRSELVCNQIELMNIL